MRSRYLIYVLSLFFSFSVLAQSNLSSVKSLSAVEFKKLVDAKSVLLIDVRTAEEFAEGYIAGAVNIDVNKADFVPNIKKLTKKKPLALYCRSGHRSKLAASKIVGLGFVIYDLNSGFKEWLQAGFPTNEK